MPPGLCPAGACGREHAAEYNCVTYPGAKRCAHHGFAGHTTMVCKGINRRPTTGTTPGASGGTQGARDQPHGPRSYHLCGIAGHLMRDCPKRPPRTAKFTCFNCGEPWHMAGDCPSSDRDPVKILAGFDKMYAEKRACEQTEPPRTVFPVSATKDDP